MIFFISIQNSEIEKCFRKEQLFSYSFVNIIKGIILNKYNIPLWFIGDLIIFVFTAFITFAIIKNKKTAISYLLTYLILVIGIQIFNININGIIKGILGNYSYFNRCSYRISFFKFSIHKT